MKNKLYGIILLVLFLLLILIILNNNKFKRNNKYIYENFSSNKWTTPKNELVKEEESLNDVLNNKQMNDLYNMIVDVSTDTLSKLITTQSPLLVGPQGPPGPQGPSGTSLIASGRLINKGGSYTNTANENSMIPNYVVTRTEGTSPSASLAYMDNLSAFAPYQNWQLDINNNLVNRYDGNCLTMNQTQDKLYIDKCSNNPNQKWNWDRSNRIISTTASDSTKLKCIGLTKPENNVLTTNLPGCSGKKCLSDTPKKFLVVKDCDINNVYDDELWSFI
jgi:hypothetical protein